MEPAARSGRSRTRTGTAAGRGRRQGSLRPEPAPLGPRRGRRRRTAGSGGPGARGADQRPRPCKSRPRSNGRGASRRAGCGAPRARGPWREAVPAHLGKEPTNRKAEAPVSPGAGRHLGATPAWSPVSGSGWADLPRFPKTDARFVRSYGRVQRPSLDVAWEPGAELGEGQACPGAQFRRVPRGQSVQTGGPQFRGAHVVGGPAVLPYPHASPATWPLTGPSQATG